MATPCKVVEGMLTVLGLAVPLLGATTITLQDGISPAPGRPVYAGTTDAWLNEGSTRNYGADPFLTIKWYNGRSDATVIRFDLTGQIPANQRILSATLSLYFSDGNGTSSEAFEIKPYRIAPTKPWFENIYNGTAGYGVNWKWRDNAQTQEWTSQDGAWWDKIDDSNGTRWVQDEDGTVGPPQTPYVPIKPGNWVDFNVVNSVRQWYAGQTNQGFSLFAVNYVGGYTTTYGLFCSRNHTTQWARPKLVITYEGALAPIAEAGGPYSMPRKGAVQLNGAASYDPDGGSLVSWLWDLDNDLQYDDASGATATVTYLYLANVLGLGPGLHTIRLQVRDDENETSTDTAQLTMPPAGPGDLDADGDVDGTDFGRFAFCFNGTGNPPHPGCEPADLNKDGFVDGSDYGIFASCFNGSGNPSPC